MKERNCSADSTSAQNSERGSTMVEWAVLAVVVVIFLSGFFALVLPQVQAHGVKSSIEAGMLEKISVSPPQLVTVSGNSLRSDGVSILAESDADSFNAEAFNFLQALEVSLNPMIQSYGMDPEDFTYCIGLANEDGLLTEMAGNAPVPITRSSNGLGVHCTQDFINMFQTDQAKQWVRSDVPSYPSLVSSAYAISPTVRIFAVVGALDLRGRFCTVAAPCMAGGIIVGAEKPLSAPLRPTSTPTPEATHTATGEDTPAPEQSQGQDTATPTPTPTPNGNDPGPPDLGSGPEPTATPTNTPLPGCGS